MLLHADRVLDSVVSVDTAADLPPEVMLVTAADGDPPATRPDATAAALVDRVREEELAWLAVTNTDGRFLGLLDGPTLVEHARHDRLP